MSSESESDEFVDALDTTPVRASRPKPLSAESELKEPLLLTSSPKNEDQDMPPAEQWTSNQESFLHVTSEEIKEAERKAKETERRRRKVEEMRRMLNDDDEVIEQSSEHSSMASSIEGVHLSSSSHFPLTGKLSGTGSISDDVQSVISLGKVGSILGDKDTVSVDSKDSNTLLLSVRSTNTTDISISSPTQEKKDIHCPEPDVVASTKLDRSEVPVAPPRRKKKKNPPSVIESKEMPLKITDVPQGLPCPTPVRDQEHSLDLPSATRGQYVVKPQDREQDRAEGPPSTPEQTRLTSKQESIDKNSPRSSLNRRTLDDSDMKKDILMGNKDSLQQPNMLMRTKSDSGRPLSDWEILEQVKVLNLDTGEQIPLSKAEEQLPKCINPLSLHIMRLTSEYVNTSDMDKDRESEEENTDLKKTAENADGGNVWRKTTKLRKMIGKTIGEGVKKIRSVADEVYHARHNEDLDTSEEETDAQYLLKVKSSGSHKGPSEFDGIRLVQELSSEHSGAVWTMKFSSCGRLLATAGQDRLLIIWVLRESYSFFDDMRKKYNAEAKVSPTPSQESLASQQSEEITKNGEMESNEDTKSPFMAKPLCIYEGHTADLLDVSWSKNYFILSSSMDKTVRLWHISRRECLCCFQHIDFVTAIAFHPKDDRYFLSGSLDGKLRLWNIPDKKVALWNELDGQTKLITAVSFCQNGKFAVVGCYDGRCIFYNTELLKYYTQIHVRSTRGKNAQGRKISGIEPMPGEDKILVTSNDSRIRLYDLRDLSLSCKYKGYVNLSSQIKGTFSHDGKYIISGSENQFIYIWKTHHDYSKFSSARRDRNDYWEGIKAHNAVVTSAVFAPNPSIILQQLEQAEQNTATSAHAGTEGEGGTGYVIISADFSGAIKVFVNKPKSKSSGSSIDALSPSH